MNVENAEIKLETKLVGCIEGKFFIPSFQRGYRWGKHEVNQLLEDVNSNGTRNYCLQPVVVRRGDDSFMLIDGQQRLTTLFLIYKYMNISSSGFLDGPKFSLSYETRDKSEEFLASIDLSKKEENIDYWFICEAYEAIEEWFANKDRKSTLTNINKYFDENVKVIWYEVDESEDAIALFTRLNIGKIPLTNAELVRAMFLNNDNNPGLDQKKQEEISLQWDNIEKELHDDSLWYFLTNRPITEFQTRIDLILDLISKKPSKEKEIYYTFFSFDELKQEEDLNKIWKEIQHTFLILKDWHEDHEFYHKIGYLITSNTKSLQDIFALSKRKIDGRGITKKEFKSELDMYIKESIDLSKIDYKNSFELSYKNDRESKFIWKLLLLFNVESVRKNGEQTQWFPFEKFKFNGKGKDPWSLEHIHAQLSKGMQNQKDWKEWLSLHLTSIKTLGDGNDDLREEMEKALGKERLERIEFEEIQRKVIDKLSAHDNSEYVHSIANLALLNMSDNTALSNSTFDVKRNRIIEMDKKGQFIPFCTKMVFLKYYTPSESNQLHFWGEPDRKAYIDAINDKLKHYLGDVISIEMEAE
jgi:hypothetical protein